MTFVRQEYFPIIFQRRDSKVDNLFICFYEQILFQHVESPVYPSLREDEDEEQYVHSRRVTFHLLIEGEPFLLNFDMDITTKTDACRLRLVDVAINGNRKFRKSPRNLRAINYSGMFFISQNKYKRGTVLEAQRRGRWSFIHLNLVMFCGL